MTAQLPAKSFASWGAKYCAGRYNASMNINQVVVGGNLTRDVEVKHSQGGMAVAKFGIANNERYQSKNGGEVKETTHFVDCVAFGNTAENLAKFFQKGSRIVVEGKLQFSSWEGNDGTKRSKLEVLVNRFHFVDRKNDNPGNGGGRQASSRQSEPDYGDVPF